MGRPDLIERISTALVALIAVSVILNGLYMTADPYGWYLAVPSVKFTGPPNQHLLRDIGLTYLTSGGLLAYAAFDLRGRWMFAIAGNIWLSLHSIFHLYEVAAGVCSPTLFWQAVPGTVAPPAFGWAAILLMLSRQKAAPAGLPGKLLVAMFARMSGGEVDWLKDIERARGHAFEKLMHLVPATTHRHSAPADLFHVARIAATLIEDCGSCALTAAHVALRDGVSRDLVNAALKAAPPPGHLRTAFDFGQSIALQSDLSRGLGDAIEQTHGRATRVELALTCAAVRVYPAIKRGLGQQQPCGMAAMRV